MSYKIFIDKEHTFECKLQLEGDDLSKYKSRLILECQNLNLLFPGKIANDGTCSVPISKLKNVLKETTGKITLEVISDDVYFSPWSSDLTLQESKKLTVEVIQPPEEKKELIKVLEIKEIKQEPILSNNQKMANILKENNITKDNILKESKKYKKIVLKLIKESGIPDLKIKEVINLL